MNEVMKKRRVFLVLFLIYWAILIKVMVFKDVPTLQLGSLQLNFAGTDGGHPANFIPLKTILPYLLGDKGWIIAGINLAGNIVFLIPLGLLAPFIFSKFSWKKCLALALSSGLAIETVQVLLQVGIFDIDDVILNVLGVMIGYWAIRVIGHWLQEKKYKTLFITMVFFVALITVIGARCLADIQSQPRLKANSDLSNNQQPLENFEEGTPQANNPCGDTQGTGQIISNENNAITIQRNDGSTQLIKLGTHTAISNANGPIPASDLKVGERVTIVIYDNVTAAAVLVCNPSN